MANIKSQIKRNTQNEKRRVRNKGVRSDLKTHIKNAAVVAESGADSEEALRQAIIRIDRAASRGVIHKNTAARRKSRLVKRVRSLSAG